MLTIYLISLIISVIMIGCMLLYPNMLPNIKIPKDIETKKLWLIAVAVTICPAVNTVFAIYLVYCLWKSLFS